MKKFIADRSGGARAWSLVSRPHRGRAARSPAGLGAAADTPTYKVDGANGTMVNVNLKAPRRPSRRSPRA